MKRLDTMALALMAASWVACSATADPLPNSADVLRGQGIGEYEVGHYAEAIVRFRGAAALGDQRCAEMLALMYRYGERLYGDQVHADPVEAAHWASVAARSHAVVAAIGAASPH